MNYYSEEESGFNFENDKTQELETKLKTLEKNMMSLSKKMDEERRNCSPPGDGSVHFSSKFGFRHLPQCPMASSEVRFMSENNEKCEQSSEYGGIGDVLNTSNPWLHNDNYAYDLPELESKATKSEYDRLQNNNKFVVFDKNLRGKSKIEDYAQTVFRSRNFGLLSQEMNSQIDYSGVEPPYVQTINPKNVSYDKPHQQLSVNSVKDSPSKYQNLQQGMDSQENVDISAYFVPPSEDFAGRMPLQVNYSKPQEFYSQSALSQKARVSLVTEPSMYENHPAGDGESIYSCRQRMFSQVYPREMRQSTDNFTPIQSNYFDYIPREDNRTSQYPDNVYSNLANYDPDKMLILSYQEKLAQLDIMCKEEMNRVRDASYGLGFLNQIVSDWKVEEIEKQSCSRDESVQSFVEETIGSRNDLLDGVLSDSEEEGEVEYKEPSFNEVSKEMKKLESLVSCVQALEIPDLVDIEV